MSYQVMTSNILLNVFSSHPSLFTSLRLSVFFRISNFNIRAFMNRLVLAICLLMLHIFPHATSSYTTSLMLNFSYHDFKVSKIECKTAFSLGVGSSACALLMA